MTASLYNIAKACILQSKYKTNNTNNLTKISYITNNESCIFIQEEINFITYLHDVPLCRWVLERSQFNKTASLIDFEGRAAFQLHVFQDLCSCWQLLSHPFLAQKEGKQCWTLLNGLTIYNCSFCFAPFLFQFIQYPLVHSIFTGTVEYVDYAYPWSGHCNKYLPCLCFQILQQIFQVKGQKLLFPLSVLLLWQLQPWAEFGTKKHNSLNL